MARKTMVFAEIAILAVSCLTIACGSLITVPRNTVAKLGDRVEFECSTSETVSTSADEGSPPDWKFFSATSSAEQFIYQTGVITHNFSSKYAINDSKQGSYNLVMNSVNFSYAGRYSCSKPFLGDRPTVMASADLIVIASDPVCSFNATKTIMEGDYISMWCVVSYRGNCIPTMEWSRNDGRNVDADIRSNNTPTTATSNVILRFGSNDKGVTFMCKTSFKTMVTNSSWATITQHVEDLPTHYHYWYLWNYTATFSTADSDTIGLPGLDNGLLPIIGIGIVTVILFIVIVSIICKLRTKDKSKPDVVPQLKRNNFEHSDHPQPQHNTPVYAEIQRSSTGFQVVENHPLPIYASVEKERKGFQAVENHTLSIYASVEKKRKVGITNERTVSNNCQHDQGIPVYTEVNKAEREKKINGQCDQIGLPLPISAKPKQNYIGADGTHYMELDSLTELKSNEVPERQPPMFSLVETYATIDHTISAPPPLPMPRRH